MYRLTKYTHDWTRLGSASLYGANTYIPFDAGSARITHDGTRLFVRTCHEMYADGNGTHHQANVTIEVDITSMTVTGSSTAIANEFLGYSSHSFNQFVKTENGYLLGVDHGDANPRSIALFKYTKPYTNGYFPYIDLLSFLKIPAEASKNETGVSIGGFEFSSAGYLVAGNKKNFSSSSDTRNIFVSFLPKNGTDAMIHEITDYPEGTASASTPQFIQIGTDRYLLLWERDQQVWYCTIDGSGDPVSETGSMNANLSDCVPLVFEGNVVWYTWKDGILSFHTIDLSDLSNTSTKQLTFGHTYSYSTPETGETVCTKTCTVCSYQEQFTVYTDFKLWWKDPVYYYEDPKPGLENRTMPYLLRSTEHPDDTTLEFEISDPSMAEMVPDGIHFLRSGTFTLTVYPKYNPSVKKQYSFEVLHDFQETGSTPPTKTESGTRLYKCTACGEESSRKVADVPSVKLLHRPSSAGTILQGTWPEFEDASLTCYEVLEYGILYINYYRVYSTAVTENTKGIQKVAFTEMSDNGSWAIKLYPKDSSNLLSFAAYLKYRDGNGEIHTVYDQNFNYIR